MRGRIKEMVFASERTRGNLLTVQCLADFGVFARIAPRPNRCERRGVRGRRIRGLRRRVRHEGDLPIRPSCKARAIFCTAKRTVHGGSESTTTADAAAAGCER